MTDTITDEKERIKGASWRYTHCPTPDDDMAVGCDLEAADGKTIAACLWSAGEMDIDSDGCGVWLNHHTADDIDWPDEDEAKVAVWGY